MGVSLTTHNYEVGYTNTLCHHSHTGTEVPILPCRIPAASPAATVYIQPPAAGEGTAAAGTAYSPTTWGALVQSSSSSSAIQTASPGTDSSSAVQAASQHPGCTATTTTQACNYTAVPTTTNRTNIQTTTTTAV